MFSLYIYYTPKCGYLHNLCCNTGFANKKTKKEMQSLYKK